MNRKLGKATDLNARKPHACGDEPADNRYRPMGSTVHPTHVGMNRLAKKEWAGEMSKPHRCGDEPNTYTKEWQDEK